MKIKDTEPKVVKNEVTGKIALRLGIWDQGS